MASTPTINSGAPSGPLSYEIITSYGIYREDILKTLKSKVPRASTFQWMRRLSGDRMIPKRIADRHVVSHFEDREWLPGACTISSPNTGTANQVTITLSAGDYYDSGVRSYPTVGMTAVFQNQTHGYVTAVNKDTPNAHTVTIYRMNSAQDVQAAAVSGQKVVFYSNANTGASGEREGHIPQFDRVDSYIHTWREDQEVQDHELQNAMWFEYKGSDRVYIKALDEMADRFAMGEELYMLIGPQASGLTGIDGKGRSKEVRTTKGLIPQVNDGGINFEYYGTPSLTTLENLELMYDKFYGDEENLVAAGINADQGWRHWLLEFCEGSDKGITFDGFDKQKVGINLKSAKIGSYVFHFDCWKVLSHPGTLGTTGFPYRDMILTIPMGGGNVNVMDRDGGYSKEFRKYFRMVYAPGKGPKNKIVNDIFIWQTGALADIPTSDVLTREYHMASYKSLELFCINKFSKIEKAA